MQETKNMHCTACDGGELMLNAVDGLFTCHLCQNCGGHWLLIKNFLDWKEKNPNHDFSTTVSGELEAIDSIRALFCPETGVIMSKFKISLKNSHRIDYSAKVGGIWLDKGEWELLKQEGLAGSLNAIITSAWQNKLRSQRSAENFSAIYKEKFGEDDYKKLKAFREWLDIQPSSQRMAMKNYLAAVDPYSAEK